MRKLLMVVAAVLSYASSSQAQVLCESLGPGEAYRECRVGSSGVIYLIREISDRACHETLTWGVTGVAGVVWVRRGCRATFGVVQPEAGLKPRASRSRVVCESVNGQLQSCSADTGQGVVFAQQLSQATCEEGESWGVDLDRQVVWVDRGCRAEFVLGGLAEPLDTSAPIDQPVLCESVNGKRTSCNADTAGGVRIARQLSEGSCRYGREWGYDANGIWVAKGCRAEFVVRGKPRVMLQSVKCESQNNGRNHCDADTRYGVAVFRTLGDSKCILGQSWGFDERGVWVDGGCRAHFALGGYRLPADALPPNAAKVTCESLDGGDHPCPVDTSHGVGLLRQISVEDCILNRTWGYDREGIWVTNGCRAEFAVAR